MLARDWRAGELGVLAVALVIAVASITSVGFFADRVGRALERDAHQLLGGDLVLVSDHPFERKFADEIRAGGAQAAGATSFISMAIAGEKTQLASVKAVTENYPLRGQLRIAPAPGAADASATRGPPRGKVWLEERLVSALGAPVGARLQLGRTSFEVGAVLTLEPERSASFFNLAPRILMNSADLESTGLIQTGSRARYYLYAAGAPEKIAALENRLKQSLGRGQQLETLENGRPQVRESVERAQRFLGLTALLAAILAGVAIALATRRYVERHLDGCAVLRCLGATQARLMALFGTEFLVLGLIACAAGIAAGAIAQSAIGAALSGLIDAALPAPSLLPGLQGLFAGLVLLLGFALPPLLQLKNVPAMRVIRREAGSAKASSLAAYAAGSLALGGLLVWQAGDLKMGAYVTGGFAGALLLYYALSRVILRLLSANGLIRRVGSPALRYGIASLRRHASGNAVQTASLALGLTALLVLAFTRSDLVDAWRRSAPPDAPNRFVLGVQQEQLADVRAFLGGHGLAPEFYPMVRGRVIARNGRPVHGDDYTEDRARRLIEREFNLSYGERIPGHNSVSAGRWFAPGAQEISVEEGIAQRLGWKLGDELTFSVGGQNFSARISSLRKLRWDSMKVNFFIIGSPALLAGFPTSYISAFRVQPDQAEAMSALVERFPNISVVDTGAMLRQAQAVIDQLVNAVQVVFLFALGAGLLVLYAALVATEDERRREAALMRVCGASRAQVAASQRFEFLAMGLVAGVLAAMGAAAIGELLARQVFDLDLAPSPALWLSGPLAGLVLLSLNAWLSARTVLRAPPALTLRDS